MIVDLDIRESEGLIHTVAEQGQKIATLRERAQYDMEAFRDVANQRDELRKERDTLLEEVARLHEVIEEHQAMREKQAERIRELDRKGRRRA